MERGLRNRPAGFMTYVLVTLGSTLFMLTNQYISLQFPETDPTRLAAQVVSGIGFLGVGMIMVTRITDIYLKYNSMFSLRKLSQFAENQGYELFDIQRGKVTTLKEELGTLVFPIPPIPITLIVINVKFPTIWYM